MNSYRQLDANIKTKIINHSLTSQLGFSLLAYSTDWQNIIGPMFISLQPDLIIQFPTHQITTTLRHHRWIYFTQ